VNEHASPVTEQISEICSAGPGPELVGLLQVAGDAGCAVWHALDGVLVPRMLWTSEGHTGQLPRRRLQPIVLEMIEQGSQGAFNIACGNPTARTQIKRLAAAVYCDLLGVSEADTADLLGYGSEEDHWTGQRRAKGLHKVAGEGRELWAQLGAWPWWSSRRGDGELPTGWWSDPAFQRDLDAWCGRRLPAVLAARAMRSRVHAK
jgi:hypothetical protein